ncbi:MAG: Uma2 family endonuclease [Chloroflexi bacterium]|nr:Uma2 family endonuclease [Chloroflexota bacterium]
MLRQLKTDYTPEEYLALEEVAESRHEYFEGQIYMMAGGSADHSLITVNLASELRQQLKRKPCRVFNSDLRLYVEGTTLYTYPDVMVICGKIEYARGRDDTALNPSVIIEVLSPATRKYDRTEKFRLYKHIPSFQEYLLVESSRAHIEHYRLEGRRWSTEIANGLDKRIAIETLNCEILIGDIYDKVSWRE